MTVKILSNLSCLLLLLLAVAVTNAQEEIWLDYGTVLASDGASVGDIFGQKVAVSDTVLVVGDGGADTTGKVYVYELDIDEFAETAILTPDSAGAAVGFGFSVAVDNQTIVVGTPGQSAAYVFVKSEDGSSWDQQQKIESASPVGFGSSVAVSGDLLAVGEFVLGVVEGPVRVYERTNTNWSEIASLSPADTADPIAFGFSLDLDREALIVGAPAKNSDDGGVYLFGPVDGSNWEQTDTLNGTTSEGFGYAVSISGSRIGVGRTSGEKVTVYARSFGPDFLVVDVDAADDATSQLSDNFGYSVAIFGDTLVVGAEENDENGDNSGALYVYKRDRLATTEVWNNVAKLTAGDVGDNLGASVAVSNDFVIGGASNSDISGSSVGAAHVFVQDPETQPPSVIPSQAPSVAPSPGPERLCSEFFSTEFGCPSNRYAMFKLVRPNDQFGRPMACNTLCVRSIFLQFRFNRGYRCGSCLSIL